MEPFVSRLIVERQELDEKISKLRAFMAGDAFKTVDKVQQMLLAVQYQAMVTYSLVLSQRIDLLMKDTPHV